MMANSRKVEELHAAKSRSEEDKSCDSSHLGALDCASGRSRKFDEVMQVYQKSMAVRRRLTSASRSPNRIRNDRSDALAEANTPAQTSGSLRGPQLQPSDRITRGAPVPSTEAFASPQSPQVLPRAALGVVKTSATTATASQPKTKLGAETPVVARSSIGTPKMPHSRMPLPALHAATHLSNLPNALQETLPSSPSSFSATAAREGCTKCGDRGRDGRRKSSASRNDAAPRKSGLTGGVYLNSPYLLLSTLGWRCTAHVPEVAAEQERTASWHNDGSASGSFDGSICSRAGQPLVSAAGSRPPSPTPSFHQLIGGSYDIPALEAIFRGPRPSRAPPPLVHAGISAVMPTRKCPRKSAAAAAVAPASSPSRSTSLKLSSSVTLQPSVPPPAVAAASQVSTLPAPAWPAATAAAQAPPARGDHSGLPHFPAKAAAKETRRGSYPADKARPEANGPRAVSRRGGVQTGEALALAGATAQFYSTASLAKTFDGAQYLNDYILLNEIGSGSTGRVVLAFSTSMNKSVAIKIVLKPKAKHRLHLRTLAPTSVSGQCSGEGGSGVGDGATDVPATTTSKTMPSFMSSSSSSGRQSQCNKTSPTCFTTVESKTRNLQREIEVMKDLNHPNIVRLYEVINDPKANSLFLILQYVDSGAIAQLDSTGHIRSPLQPSALLPIATQVCDGLVYLHGQHIVHRDIKPENILVNRDGQAFLADFGVAELMNAEAGRPNAATLDYRGTPLFMSPEIYAAVDGEEGDADALRSSGGCARRRGSGVAERSSSMQKSVSLEERRGTHVIDPFGLDVWALGVTFYTLLVGRVPFTSMLQIRQTLEHGVDIPTSLPEQWRTVLRRTMEPRHELRISSAELCRMLHAMAAEQAVAEDTGGVLGEEASRSARSRSAAFGTRCTTSHQSQTESPSARSASFAAETGEESVNLGSRSSSSVRSRNAVRGTMSGDGHSTAPSSCVSGNEQSTSECDQCNLTLSITSSVLDVQRPTSPRKKR
ncbi:hypothetical protein LSCM1_06536 [Leishmania martiniquensis]|uniref:Protein kinase domain-containing protein n=1 Tax=Leishmania martiniquensis TaxID=1580590 RepID=A0A836KT60_9TRYP|nr:hypothetical protein LSCM1_06536 [Leishmania martiniquensis]